MLLAVRPYQCGLGIRIEHVAEQVDVDVFDRKTCPNDIVGACHDFENTSFDIGMNHTGGYKETLAWIEVQDVEDEGAELTRIVRVQRLKLKDHRTGFARTLGIRAKERLCSRPELRFENLVCISFCGKYMSYKIPKLFRLLSIKIEGSAELWAEEIRNL